MASTASVSGMVSGLDTASIISQLMQVEANPQTQLKTRLGTANTSITTLQSLNAKFAALATKATELSKPGAWTPLTTTSSSTAVTAVAGPTASPGTLSFTVNATATAHQLTFAQSALGNDVVLNDAEGFVKLDLQDGNDLPFIETGDGTLNSLVSAVNKANAGVTASTVKLDDGSLRLRVVSNTTGLESGFTLTNTDDSPILGGAALTAGQDASLTIGGDTVHSSSNTFAGVVTGLDISVAAGTAPGTTVDITTSRDTTTAQTSVQGLVDSANELLTQIDKLTAYDAASGKSGPLSGDATIRGLRSQVVMAVTQAADGTSLASVGIQTDRYGKIAFDATKFGTAYAANPQGVSNQLGAAGTTSSPGFAARLAAVADQASNPTTGQLSTSILNRQSTAKRMQTDIDSWDIRLASKQVTLTRQFTTLEVSLNKLKNQSSWLAGQINQLSNS